MYLRTTPYTYVEFTGPLGGSFLEEKDLGPKENIQSVPRTDRRKMSPGCTVLILRP